MRTIGLWTAIRLLGWRRGWRHWLLQADMITEDRARSSSPRVHHGDRPRLPGWRRKG